MSVDWVTVVVAAVVVGLTSGLIFLFAGIQRIPWRYAALIALGIGVVMLAGSLASAGWTQNGQAGGLILLAAFGGGLAVRGYERGKAQRDAQVEAIIRPR